MPELKDYIAQAAKVEDVGVASQEHRFLVMWEGAARVPKGLTIDGQKVGRLNDGLVYGEGGGRDVLGYYHFLLETRGNVPKADQVLVIGTAADRVDLPSGENRRIYRVPVDKPFVVPERPVVTAPRIGTFTGQSRWGRNLRRFNR